MNRRLLQAVLPLAVTLGLSGCSTSSDADPHARFTAALQKEIDNRALARHVVPVLAERHAGSDQGQFWSSYTALEILQAPRYTAIAERHGFAPARLKTRIKGDASLLISWAFPQRFTRSLAGATEKYVEELRAIPVPPDPEDAEFRQYMIEQEEAQVKALAQAAAGRYQAAADELEAFIAMTRCASGEANGSAALAGCDG